QDVGRLVRSPHGRLARRDRIALILLVNTGLRRDEAISLTWRDLVPTGDGYQLSVESGKGDKPRAIPLTNTLVDELLSWKKWCNAGDDDRVLRGFKSTQLTDSITGAQLYNIVRKAGKAIGRPKLAPHDLRRTYAMQLYNQNVKTEVISLLLGHESVETTIRYLNVKVSPDAVVHFPID
ncbi:MAG: tyrosine-type recombinase/integrase, partial [Candidatus Promineifilaceae bacterium]